MVEDLYLGKYKSLNKGRACGYATVFLVRNPKYGYTRCVKVLKKSVSGENDPEWNKFVNECSIVMNLGNGGHHGIVRMEEPELYFPENSSRWAIAFAEMEYIQGRDAARMIATRDNRGAVVQRHYIPVDEVIRMATDISSALQLCHVDAYKYCLDPSVDDVTVNPDNGLDYVSLLTDKQREELMQKYRVVHMDVTPGNIMRRDSGEYVLIDFGLAVQGYAMVNTVTLKEGTVEYKAPECWSAGSKLTPATDIYSLGVVLFECLCGRVPFEYPRGKTNKDEGIKALVDLHKNGKVPSIRKEREKLYKATHNGGEYEHDVPQWLEQLVYRCLEKDPKNRFADGAVLHQYILANNNETTKATNLHGRIHALEEEAASATGAADTKLAMAREKIREAEKRMQEAENKALEAEKQASAARSEVKGLKDQIKAKDRKLLQLKTDALGNKSQSRVTYRTGVPKWLVGVIVVCVAGLSVLIGKTYCKPIDEMLTRMAPYFGKTLIHVDSLDKSVPLLGNASAETLYAIGMNHYKGANGYKQDRALAREWIASAASKGHVKAQTLLGKMYRFGIGGDKDFDKAKTWLVTAGGNNDAEALYNLALMYKNGNFGDGSKYMAADYFEKAAQLGHGASAYEAGLMYCNGIGVAKDVKKAMKLYRQAAEKGETGAMNNLGYAYNNGNEAVAKNMAEAEKWYRKSAEGGHMTGQTNLGIFYFNKDVPDYAEAVKWFRKAAENNYGYAQYLLGYMYEFGLGVGKDRAEALQWYKRSADNNDELGKKSYERLKGEINS